MSRALDTDGSKLLSSGHFLRNTINYEIIGANLGPTVISYSVINILKVIIAWIAFSGLILVFLAILGYRLKREKKRNRKSSNSHQNNSFFQLFCRIYNIPLDEDNDDENEIGLELGEIGQKVSTNKVIHAECEEISSEQGIKLEDSIIKTINNDKIMVDMVDKLHAKLNDIEVESDHDNNTSLIGRMKQTLFSSSYFKISSYYNPSFITKKSQRVLPARSSLVPVTKAIPILDDQEKDDEDNIYNSDVSRSYRGGGAAEEEDDVASHHVVDMQELEVLAAQIAQEKMARNEATL